MRNSKYRFLWMLLVGILISLVMNLMLRDYEIKTNRIRLIDFISSITITFLIWEGNLRLDNWLNDILPWKENYKKRVFSQLSISLIYSFLIIFFSLYSFNKFVCQIPAEKQGAFLRATITMGMLFTMIILTIEVGSQFFKQWKKTLIEVEQYKMENIQSQLQNLKSQLNPHFLFNNLSVLTSLVYQDQDKAADFIQQLSKVYRYLLDNKNHELVSLEEELIFLDSYFFLLKIRFGENILFKVNTNIELKNNFIPPLAIQTLVENAIKHNEISSKRPLEITITTENNQVIICNPLQLRNDVENSTKLGIENLKKRYSFLSENFVEIQKDEKSFCVKLPLLKTKEL